MPVYEVSGEMRIITGEATIQIPAFEATNPITGGLGVETVKIFNSSSANIGELSFTRLDETYTFANVATSLNSGSGANATFTVTVGYGNFIDAVLVDAGTGYGVGTTVKILGTELGGTTTANDVIISVDSIVGTGAGPIKTFSILSGTPAWPQSAFNVYMQPNETAFIKVTSGSPATGVNIVGAIEGNLYITPVTIV